MVPPIYRRFCDEAAPLIRNRIRDALNAEKVGDLYVGDIEHKGVEHYVDKAYKLGMSLCGAPNGSY